MFVAATGEGTESHRPWPDDDGKGRGPCCVVWDRGIQGIQWVASKLQKKTLLATPKCAWREQLGRYIRCGVSETSRAEDHRRWELQAGRCLQFRRDWSFYKVPTLDFPLHRWVYLSIRNPSLWSKSLMVWKWPYAGRIEGNKISKDRITVGLCVNSTGTERLKPLIIHTAKKPRCFRGWKPTCEVCCNIFVY